MESNDKFYFSIGEVSEILNLPVSQLRFWSGEFDLNVRKNRKGDRLYQQEDIEKLKKIKQLLKEEGFTIEGAKKKIKDKNIDQKIITSNLDHNEIIETLLSIKSGLEDLKNSI
jgi:DNA-binding transcriptional MerR regulator